MNDGISEEQVQIIHDFVQESRDLIDQLEPTIIELGRSCKDVDCWIVRNCNDANCPRFEKKSEMPCWLDVGWIDGGCKKCGLAKSAQDCLTCKVFEQINGDRETLNAIFRLFHTIKGTSAFLELGYISHVSHAAENLLDLVRQGLIRMLPSHINMLCETCDFLKAAMDTVETRLADREMASQAEAMAAGLEQAITDAKNLFGKLPKPETALAETKPAPAPVAEELEFKITKDMIDRFTQEADEILQDIEQSLLAWANAPDDADLVAELFRNFHSFKGNCGFLGYADLEKLSHQIETLLECVKTGAKLDSVRVSNLLLKFKDVLRDSVAKISQGGAGGIDGLDLYLELLQDELPKGWTSPDVKRDVPRLGEILVEQGTITEEAVSKVVNEQRKSFGEKLVDMGVASPQAVEEALKKQKELEHEAKMKAAEALPAPKAAVIKRQDIRVDLEKLDSLVNLIGEMVIAENMVVNNPDLQGLQLENFSKASQQMGKIVRELQEMAMTIRMIPVSGLFRRMIRLVHDLSAKFDKKADLQLLGEETEVDKTVIETITDPLVHLVRNSLDHGLETHEERIKSGKPETGRVTLSARHEEGEVWIVVEDDGRGLNREKIVAKAISKGLIEGDGSQLSDKGVYSLIFQPGFSTADKVTDVSGRGVGLDVVRKNLEKIKGKIEIHSKPGQGTQFILRIPLTLAIIEGMLIRVGKANYILPILSVKEFFRPNPKSLTRAPGGQEIVRLREGFLPVIRLHELYRIEPDHAELHDGTLVVVEAHEQSIALFVDEILGQQQTVIKGLSNFIGSAPGISGCTILGNGDVCLIIDVGSLIELTQK